MFNHLTEHRKKKLFDFLNALYKAKGICHQYLSSHEEYPGHYLQSNNHRK
jgi:hypothetical protein